METFKVGDLVEIDHKASIPEGGSFLSHGQAEARLTSSLGPSPWKITEIENSIEPRGMQNLYFSPRVWLLKSFRFKLFDNTNERNQRFLRKK